MACQLRNQGLRANRIQQSELDLWLRNHGAQHQVAKELPGFMKTLLRDGPQTDAPDNAKDRVIPARERVLEVACEMFAEAGFHGTHLREVCKRSGTNVAGVCYHFHSKEGLYEAVCMEAGRQLSDSHKGLGVPHDLPAEETLLKQVESLLRRLGTKRAWIAKLLSRELVDPVSGVHNYAASGLEWNFILLQAVMRELLGTKAKSEAAHFHALSVLGECVFYSLVGENALHPLCQFGTSSPARERLAISITERALGAIERERSGLEVQNP